MKKEKRVRIYFILADENLFHPAYVRGILHYAKENGIQILGITLAKENYRKGFIYAVKQQIMLWGIIGFFSIGSISALRTIVTKMRLNKNWTIDAIAKSNSIPLYRTSNVNRKEHLVYLRKKKIDIIISSNGHIFKKDLLQLPKIACINRHSGLLPSYGGVLPLFWTMLKNEKRFGVSVHYMVEKVDKGNILAQFSEPLEKGNSMFYNYKRAFAMSIDATLLAIENAQKNKVVEKYHKSDNEYFSFPSKIEIKNFNKKMRTISFSDVLGYVSKR